MANLELVSTTLASHYKLSDEWSPKTLKGHNYMHDISYANSPNIAYVMSVVSMFMSNLGRAHWQALKWILHYLNRSLGRVFVFGGAKRSTKDDALVEGFVRCFDTRKSLMDYVFIVYGIAISWKTCLQNVMTLSTIEVEYIVTTEVVKEASWLKDLAKNLKVQKQVVIVFCDNNNTLQLSKKQVFHDRTKHIDVKLHFMREEITRGFMKVTKVSTNQNPFYMIMKVLSCSKFFHCLDSIQLISD